MIILILILHFGSLIVHASWVSYCPCILSPTSEENLLNLASALWNMHPLILEECLMINLSSFRPVLVNQTSNHLSSICKVDWTWYPSVAQSCLSLCDPMDCSTIGFPVLHYLPEFAQTNGHWPGDVIQPSYPLNRLFSFCPQSFPAPRSFPMLDWTNMSL